jgi:hypothetical protein
VFVAGQESGDSVFADGNDELVLAAHVRIQTSGGASISTVPTWFSDDMGGTISQDWGDFDRDGDLDLVLGSSLGATVYQNDHGTMTQFWESSSDMESDYRLSYGVAWADLDGDPLSQLELVVVGDSVSDGADSPGLNYTYAYSPTAEDFFETAVFTSLYQLVRVSAGDYDGDGDVDLIGATNAIVAPNLCPVVLYRNGGGGSFTGTVSISDTLRTADSPDVECLADQATAALGPADYDNDGDLDMVVGSFPSSLLMLRNSSGSGVVTDTNPFEAITPITVESGLEYPPYDLGWGDFDLDGDLDLAAAYPLQREVHVYRNRGAMGFERLDQIIRTAPFMTPLTLDWGDYDGDGWLELLVADSPPRIYS